MWRSACYRLKPRDEYIGWTPTQRAQRQKLVVQNRRFLLLAERGEQPNLASYILEAAARELPSLWHKAFGYQPLLAETFTDIEAFEGTCYKASGWEGLGDTKLVQIVRFANRLRNDQRKELGLPRFSSDNSYRKVSSYKVNYNLLRKLDIDAFAQCLSAWLAKHSVSLPAALALDGKFVPIQDAARPKKTRM